MSDDDLTGPGYLDGDDGANPAPAPMPATAPGADPPSPKVVRKPLGPEARSVVPAALAALAESGPLFLAARLFAKEAVGSAAGGPMATYPLFVALFVATVSAGALLRRTRAVPVAVGVLALALGLVQAFGWGNGEPAATLFTLIVALLVGLRAASLALHDWRNPVSVSFAWGAAALFVMALIGGRGGFGDPLGLVVAVFFTASLASRAATTALYGGAGDEVRVGAGRLLRTAMLWVLGLGLVFGLVAALGWREGGLELIGKLLDPVVAVIAGVLVFVLVQLARPLLWLGDRIGVNAEGLRRLLDRLQGGDTPDPDRAPSSLGGPVERIIGLVLLVAIVVVVVWAIRRQRDRLERALADVAPDEEAELRRLEPLPRSRRQLRRGPRRELPEDTVRRWYAEALLELERIGVERPPDTTPAEFLDLAARAHPEVRAPFAALTRAYEDVRYGLRRLGRDEVRGLAPRHEELMRVLARAEPASVRTDGTRAPGQPG